MLTLRIDKTAFTKDFCEYLAEISNVIAEDMLSEMNRKFKSKDAKNNNEKLATITDETEGYIYSEIINYSRAIIDSYGTGLYMLDTEYLDDYMQSEFWNKLRTGKTIVGRAKGKYTNIFGKEKVSKGTMAGKPIKLNGGYVNGIQPTNAIENTEIIFFTNRIQNRVNRLIPQWIEDNAFNYFYNAER